MIDNLPLSKVILVEDDLIVSKMHTMQLVHCGQPEPENVINGLEAIEYLDEHHHRHSKFLILLDLNMPVMDGWQFLKLCHSRNYIEKLVVFIVTSSSFKEDQEKALDFERVLGYYKKPLRKEHLQEVIAITKEELVRR